MAAPIAPRSSRRVLANPQLVAGAVLLGLFVLVAFGGSTLMTHDPKATDLAHRLEPPFRYGHLLGTDDLGRDLFSRTIAGFRWSLGVATAATLIASMIGSTIGILAGWTRGIVKAVLVRLIDIGISFPGLVLAVIFIAVVGRGFLPVATILGVVAWPAFARVMLAESSSVKNRDFVLAARVIGVRSSRILTSHVVPGVRSTLVVMWAFVFAEMLIAESALSFLGLGAPIDAPTWGNLLSASRNYLVRAPWHMLVPAAAIVAAVVSANLIGDGLATNYRTSRRA